MTGVSCLCKRVTIVRWKYLKETSISAKQRSSSRSTRHPAMALNFTRGWLSALLRSPFRLLHALLPRLIAGAPATSFVDADPTAKEDRMPKFYHDDEAWADIDPLPQDDGGMHPLAAISYTDEYSEAMGYLRAVMAKSEFSERGLGLTEHIISMNPAHYTVW